MTQSARFKYHPHTLIMDNEAERIFHDVVLQDLAQIRHFVRETAVAGSYQSTALDELVLAMNEAVSNIIWHGYQADPGDIKVIVSANDDVIKVTLIDNAVTFDPTTVSSPDTTSPLEKRPFGGMGVHMMREFCDELSYRRTKNDENELTLLKRVGH